jgi:myb proto-oncogene protein
MGTWTEDEDIKLKAAVERHGGKDWDEIAALVRRTKIQCWSRWHNTLNPRIALTGGSKGKWTLVEDDKLKDAVQTHGGKNWDAIAALVPGRSRIQCRSRWQVLRRRPKQDGNTWTLIVAQWVKGHSTLKKAPALGQNVLSP